MNTIVLVTEVVDDIVVENCSFEAPPTLKLFIPIIKPVEKNGLVVNVNGAEFPFVAKS